MFTRSATTEGLSGWLETLGFYLDSGGFVMPPLLIITVVLWYAIGTRWALLQRGSRKNVRVLLKRYLDGRAKPADGIVDLAIARGVEVLERQPAYLRRHLDVAFADFERDIRRWATPITALVAIAPLLGLLGTVSGMIVTFESLGDMSLFSQTGGIAGGIATALFTTQLGLVVAVPGVIVKALLDRRQQQLQHDLDQLKDILVCAPAPTEEG
jgi:biopolymer transport protein ExbB